MAKPTKIEFLDAAGANEFEESTELPPNKKQIIKARITSGDNAAHKTGVVVRLFTKVDGFPVVTILVLSNEDNGTPQPSKDVTVRPVRGTSPTLQVVAWDRKGVKDATEVTTRRIRLTVKK